MPGTGKKQVDPRLWNIDPNALGGPPSGPISIRSPAVEQILIQAAHLTSPFGRRLGPGERDLIYDIYRSSVDTARIRVVEARIANAPTTLGNQIRVKPGFSFKTEEGKSTLIHEAGHVWQYQTTGTRYITCSAYNQIRAHVKTGNRNAAYFNYTLDNRRSIGDYAAEEQATIIEDFYQLTVRYKDQKIVPDWVKMRRPDLPKYERLIKQVRSYRPKTQTQVYTDSLMHTRTRHGLPLDSHLPDTMPLVPILEIRFDFLGGGRKRR